MQLPTSNCGGMKYTFPLALLLSGSAAFSQVIRHPVRTTYIGMAAYSISHVDPFSFSSNTASLARIDAPVAGVFGEQKFLLAETSFFKSAGAFTTGQGSIGIDANYFGNKNYNESQVGMGYARRLGKSIDLGIKFNYFCFAVAGYGGSSAINAEIGIMAHFSEKFHAGVQIFNPIGGKLSKVQDEKLGSVYTLGIGYEPSSDFLVSAEIIREEDLPLSVNAGIMYNFGNIFFAKAGFVSVTESPYGGAGIAWDVFQLQLSASYHPQLGISPGVALILHFKNQVE